MLRKRFVLGLALVTLFGLGWWVGRGGANGGLYGPMDTFIEVLHRVEDSYVDPVDPEKLVSGAVQGLMKQLDPYSQLLGKDSWAQLQSTTQGEFGGIGVLVSVRDNVPTVISPIEGSPAWRAGMRSGDAILRIDGKSTVGFTTEDTSRLLRGAQGTTVRVAVRGEGEEEDRELTIQRDIIETKSVPYAFMVDREIGYLRLASFSEKSGAEVRAALERLRGLGARRLVLDLRSNPGGVLDQAVDVASQFLPRGSLVVSTRGRDASQNERYTVRAAGAESQWPLVTLVDAGSASAAEIVAGALQDLDRSLLVGHTTFGKGSVQRVFPLRGRDEAVKLTTALYYTPSGRSIHRRTPAATDEDAEDDSDSSGAPGDSVTPAAPVYRTAAGRTVKGGGGITPDLAVTPDSLPGAVAEVERRALPFRFANRWANTHPGLTLPDHISDEAWKGFETFLAGEKTAPDAASLAAARPRLEQSLRRELARRLEGDAAAAQVALGNDPVFQQALRALRRAREPRDVFATVPVPPVEPREAVPAR